jgi:hypothetical protein
VRCFESKATRKRYQRRYIQASARCLTVQSRQTTDVVIDNPGPATAKLIAISRERTSQSCKWTSETKH